MRSLTWKLVTSFLAVSLTVAILAAVLARWISIHEFNQLVRDQATTRFVNEMTYYYTTYHTWDGVLEYLGRRPALVPRPAVNPAQPQPQAGLSATPRPGAPLPANPPLENTPPLSRSAYIFVLAGMDGRVIIPAGPYRIGSRLPAAELAAATPIQVDGQTVGYALATGSAPPLDPREGRYLARTNQALFLAGLAATLVALLLGILLARTLARPLSELTAAIRRMAGGQLEQQVPVRSTDEIGELAAAFNQMSADLARANQARRQMTADIAHDLRTPLTVIAGYAESLRDGVLKPTPKRFDVIYHETQHLQRLVEDLRTLSLADAGELRLNHQPLDAAAILGRVAAAYEQQAAQAGVSLQVDCPAGLPPFSADEERMVQVLGNLLSNALRHTQQGGKITLSARNQMQTSEDSKYSETLAGMELSVQDSGEGIPPEALPYVFDRFYRADTSRQGGESGLGLAIVRSLVEAHGGSIRAESQPGQGTRMTLTMPVVNNRLE